LLAGLIRPSPLHSQFYDKQTAAKPFAAVGAEFCPNSLTHHFNAKTPITMNSNKSPKTAQSKPNAKRTKAPAKSVAPKAAMASAAAPDSTEANLVRIHDLTGACLMSIPPELRVLLGDEAYESYMSQLKQVEVTLIIRSPHDVVYIEMPILTLKARPDSMQIQAAVNALIEPGSEPKSQAKPATKRSSTPAAKPTRKPRGQS
jgi:hypothetical protein